jgi:hypothetical protein
MCALSYTARFWVYTLFMSVCCLLIVALNCCVFLSGIDVPEQEAYMSPLFPILTVNCERVKLFIDKLCDVEPMPECTSPLYNRSWPRGLELR